MNDSLLNVDNLSVELTLDRGTVLVVDGISFHLAQKETLGIVGESGCGKSMMSLSILGLLPGTGKVCAGSSIRFKGRELASLLQKEIRFIRGNRIALIPQDSMTALNPVITIERQMVDTLHAHNTISKSEARNRSIEMLKKVGIPSPEIRIKGYPYQMSGGMKQRINIAISLLCNPDIIIADEPTTALDVTIQAQILDLMSELKETMDTAIILITHDLGVVSDMTDRILVMYAGQIMEYSDTDKLFKKSLHPYTRGLLASIPRIQNEVKSLAVIPGQVRSVEEKIDGCKFHPRCFYVTDMCKHFEPPLYDVDGQKVKCWLYRDTTVEV
jgi:oligopeptide/dipeptide ABC transporter ATP-binding protein